MKIFSYFVYVIALITIVINSTKLDFNNLFEGDSTIALIGIVASLCAIVLMLMYKTAKKLNDTTK